MTDGPRIRFTRSGGLAGRVVAARVDAGDPDAADWAGLIAGLDLPRLSAAGPGPAGPDRFSYDLTIDVGGRSYGLHFGEQALPDELRPLVRRLSERARSAPRPTDA